ncbi:MAG: type III secretion system chaperone [Actinomycetia bacterium]|nr:type III secretion system chaperone [Actinomycetes bacterium]
MSNHAATEAELAALAARFETWLTVQHTENPLIEAVVPDDDVAHRWHVRVVGDEKDVFTIRFDLGQRTLHYETYVMPAPEENEARFFQHLLKRNLGFNGAAFAVGDEEAIFLVGQLPNDLVSDDDELDRVLGSMYVYVEQCFRPALAIGFASRIAQS